MISRAKKAQLRKEFFITQVIKSKNSMIRKKNSLTRLEPVRAKF